MANIPAGIKFAWPSTVATIPAGYARYAALDGRYVRGAAAAGGTGGAATHSHPVPAHTHVQNAHDHDLTVSSDDGGTRVTAGGGATNVAVAMPHVHTGDSDPATPTNANQVAHNTNNANNDPKHLEVIFIASDGSAGFPEDAIGWWDKPVAALPADWSQHASALDRFLRGAAAGVDGGATGGADTHVHTENAHTHTSAAHFHWVGEIGPDSIGNMLVPWSPREVDIALDPHSHNVNANSGVGTITNQNATATLDAQSSDPGSLTLHAVTRAVGGDECPTGLIGVWTGLAGAIPANWLACDGTLGTPDLNGDILIRSTNIGGAALNSAGGGHVHVSAAHNHTQDAHAHTGGISGSAYPYDTVSNGTPGSPRVSLTRNHYHNYTLANQTGTNQATAITTTTATPWPLYTDVIFVQFKGAPATAGAGIDSVRVRPADWWLAYAPTDEAEGVRFLTLADVERTGDTTEHTPDLGAEGGDAPRQAITRLGASLILGFVPASPGAINIGIVDADRFHWREAAVITGDYYQVAMDVQHGSTMIVVLGLIDDAGTKRWYQTCGQWDVTAGNFDFETAVECDTDPGGDFPDAKDAGGTLRRVADGSLLFAFIDDADDIHVMRCAAMPADATGTWVEV